MSPPDPRARPLAIAVVGAGTAGSAAALYLRRAGHDVVVFERVPQPTAVGAGIVLQPTGLGVLRELGLDGEILAKAARVERLTCLRRGHARPLFDLPYSVVGEHTGLGLHRGVLFDVLQRALAAAAIPVVTGCEVTALAHFGDGVVLRDRRGRALGRFDLCVVADGARSRLRDDTDPPLASSVRRYPWGALWFIGRDAAERRRGPLLQIVDGAGSLLGLLPTGLGPGGEGPLCSLFWSIRADQVDAWRRQGLDAWRAQLLAQSPLAEPLVAQIEHLDQVTFAAYHDVVLRPWHTRNCVYLGDAAHATSPQLGQGCNLALCDARQLGRSLAGAGTLPAALADYSRQRRKQLAFYQRMTRWLTPFFQGESRLLATVRDLGFPLGARVGWMRRQMVLTMCGVKLGPFAQLPLA